MAFLLAHSFLECCYLEAPFPTREKDVRCNLRRDRAQDVAKQEIADLRRQYRREGLDLDYLKNVIIEGFQSGELRPKPSMLQVRMHTHIYTPISKSFPMAIIVDSEPENLYTQSYTTS